jgi:hypothetical protein
MTDLTDNMAVSNSALAGWLQALKDNKIVTDSITYITGTFKETETGFTHRTNLMGAESSIIAQFVNAHSADEGYQIAMSQIHGKSGACVRVYTSRGGNWVCTRAQVFDMNDDFYIDRNGAVQLQAVQNV